MTLILRAFRMSDESVARNAEVQMPNFLLHFRRDDPWQSFLDTIEKFKAGIDLPAPWLRSDFLAAEVDGQLVGRVSIRWEMNDFIEREWGHVGYEVLPQFRNNGYATSMLMQSVSLLRGEGILYPIVTVDRGNDASIRVIEKCGGVLEETIYVDREGTEVFYRYLVKE
ncbi:MAG: GNAT family N-acetyltransferase [Actinomycetes bacterium]